ncbi:hypothetical protein L0F63_000769 [Massospora cicadina]|nr:hypothetical protein L0F63_000769 [Massospora cicadina]
MNISQVPDFILEEVFEQLDRRKLLTLSQINRRWRSIILPLYWRNLEDVVLYRRTNLLKERGWLVRHLQVALNFPYRDLCGWELALSHCPYLVSGSFEVRTVHELKQLFRVATSIDSQLLLGSIEELNLDFAHHLETAAGDFLSPILTSLVCLEIDSGPRSLKSFQHFSLGNFWPLVTRLACDIGQHISRAQLANLNNVTRLSLRFASKKDSVSSIPRVLSSLRLLSHVSFSGCIPDPAFEFAPRALEGIQRLNKNFVAWLVSLDYLQKLTLVGCYDELAFTPIRFPPNATFPYLLYARFPKDIHPFFRVDP